MQALFILKRKHFYWKTVINLKVDIDLPPLGSKAILQPSLQTEKTQIVKHHSKQKFKFLRLSPLLISISKLMVAKEMRNAKVATQEIMYITRR